MSRKTRILLTLIAALVVAVGYAWLATPRQERVTTQSVASAAGGQKRSSASTAERNATVHLDLLEANNRRYTTPKRDLFDFVTPPPPKPKPLPKPVLAPPKPPPVVVAQTPEDVRRIEVRRALARFTFLGFLLKDGQRTVFLSQGDNLFLVKEGEHFGDSNRFHAISITPEKMIIRQADSEGTIEIPLVEKQPLIPSFAPSGASSVAAPPMPVPQMPSMPVTTPFPAPSRGNRWQMKPPPTQSKPQAP